MAMNSSFHPPAQVFSVSLSREQKHLVDRMVEAHRLCRAEDSSHCRVGPRPPTALPPQLLTAHGALLLPVLLRCRTGRVQKKPSVCPSSCRLRGCCSLPGRCQVRWSNPKWTKSFTAWLSSSLHLKARITHGNDAGQECNMKTMSDGIFGSFEGSRMLRVCFRSVKKNEQELGMDDSDSHGPHEGSVDRQLGPGTRCSFKGDAQSSWFSHERHIPNTNCLCLSVKRKVKTMTLCKVKLVVGGGEGAELRVMKNVLCE